MYLTKSSKQKKSQCTRPERRMCLACWTSEGYHLYWNGEHSNGNLDICNQGGEIPDLVAILGSQALTLREMEDRRVRPSGDLVY